MIADGNRHRHHRRGHHHRAHSAAINVHEVAVRVGHFLSAHRLGLVTVVLIVMVVCSAWWRHERDAPQREANAKELRYRRAVENADRLESRSQWRHQRDLERIREAEERRAAKEQARREGKVPWWRRLWR